MHFLFLAVLLGLGAAIPIGPVNLEIIRRNIRYGCIYGTVTGAGACFADLVYLILLSIGVLSLFQYPAVLQFISIIGSLILAWFGFSAFRSQENTVVFDNKTPPSLWSYGLGGFLMTLFNPYTILFWASVSTQIAIISTQGHALYLAGSGVILGAFSWVLFLNILLHFTRHYLNEKVTQILNYVGGFILLSFALLGLIKAFYGA